MQAEHVGRKPPGPQANMIQKQRIMSGGDLLESFRPEKGCEDTFRPPRVDMI